MALVSSNRERSVFSIFVSASVARRFSCLGIDVAFHFSIETIRPGARNALTQFDLGLWRHANGVVWAPARPHAIVIMYMAIWPGNDPILGSAAAWN